MLLNLKTEILRKFKTQVDFAGHVGINESKLSYIVRGRRQASKEEKQRIIKTLGVGADDVQSLFASISENRCTGGTQPGQPCIECRSKR
jgi:hypothetical protein